MITVEELIKRIETRISELDIEIDLFNRLYQTMSAKEYNAGIGKNAKKTLLTLCKAVQK